MSYNGRDLTIYMVIVAAVIMLNVGFFSNPDVAVTAVEQHKYTNISVVDHTWSFLAFRWGTPRGSMARFTVDALNAERERVTLTVYTGWLFDPVIKFAGVNFKK